MKLFSITSAFFLFIIAATFFFDAVETSTKKYPPPKRIKQSGALQALEFWSKQRAYPNTEIPDVGHSKAYELHKSSLRKTARLGSDNWRAIGPHNIGGRTLAVAFNPLNTNTIFAGSASGGLWRSYSGGKGKLAWEHLKTGFPTLSVSSIAFPPNDSNTIYIGTGEVYGYQNSFGGLSVRETRGSYGIGILKTMDYGRTWTKSLDWSYNQRRGVNAVRINPKNPKTLWAATSEGVYKSTDAGVIWTQVHNVLMAMDLQINPVDTNIVFVSCGNFKSPFYGIYRTMDGGLNWTKLSQGLPATFGGKALLTLYQSSPNVVYASIGNGSASGAGTWLCRSTDNGDSWVTLSTSDYSTYQGWYSHFVGVNPIDSSKIICGGIDLWKSISGGTNLVKKSDWAAWYFGITQPGEPEGPSNYSHADHHAIAYHPTNPNLIIFGTDGGIFQTTDGGETFSGCNGGYQTTQFYNGFSCAWTDSLLAMGGMQDNSTAIYQGTVAWKRVLGGDGCMTAINTKGADTLYGTYQYLSLSKSTNRGANFSSVSPPSSTTTGFAAPFILAPSNPRILYAGRDKVYKSTVGGGSWTTLNSNQMLDTNPLLALAVSRTNPDTVYATTAPVKTRSGVFFSSNGGVSWQNITGTLPDRYAVDLAVDPKNSAIVYVTISGFGTSHLFKSTNAGANWIDIGTGLPDVPTSAVVVDPQYTNIIYVGNDIGIFVSTNSGQTWNDFNEGLTDAVLVMDLTISPLNRMLRCASHGSGVFERHLLEPVSSVASVEQLPESFKLEQNYPNPFNPTTNISYMLSANSEVQLKIYDVTGKEVTTLIDKQQSAGTYKVIWDASKYASGVYFYKLTVGNYSQTKKMLYLR